MSNDQFYAEYPDGSARLGTEEDAQKLADGFGPIAIVGDTVLRFQEQEPAIVYGGAGCGKFGNMGAYQAVHPSTQSFLFLDMGGQYMSTTWHWNLAEGRYAYAINPLNTSSYPDINHALNLFGILENNELLFDNAEEIAELAIPESDKKGDNNWVEVDAQRWVSTFLILLVLLVGRVTPASLWQMINAIDADDEALKRLGREAEGLPYEVHSTMAEIYSKKKGSQKEYGAIMSHIKSSLRFLTSPKVAASISGDEDYLAYLADPKKKVGVYLALPSGKGKQCRSLIRMVFGIAKIHCSRAGLGARPLFYLDEAATCGSARFIKELASELRKYIRSIFVYQSQGQPIGFFGESGAQEINDNCGLQIFLGGGIRDFRSAERLANTIGKATILKDDPLMQADRTNQANKTMLEALYNGHDPLSAHASHQHEKNQSAQQGKAGRYVVDPSEVMRASDKVFVLSPGTGGHSFMADKMPLYINHPSTAGCFAPDPLFPPLDRVVTQGQFLKRSRRFIREEVPSHLAHLPNHINGEIAYVKGFKTW